MRFSTTLVLAAIASSVMAAPCAAPAGGVTTNIGSGNSNDAVASGLLSPSFGNGNAIGSDNGNGSGNGNKAGNGNSAGKDSANGNGANGNTAKDNGDGNTAKDNGNDNSAGTNSASSSGSNFGFGNVIDGTGKAWGQ